MATLYVRNFPEELLKKVKELATQAKRSLGAEVIVLIDNAVQQDELTKQRMDALDRLTRLRESYIPPAGAVDSLTLLREDRDR